MAVRMVAVEVPDEDVLGVPDAHPLHVFPGDFRHRPIADLVVGREAERGVADGVFDARVQSRLVVQAVGDGLLRRGVDPLAAD